MPPVTADARLAELVHLDVLDVTPDGRLSMNAGFIAMCRAAIDADPTCLDDVFQSHILARAAERGFAILDVDAMALAALEVAVGEATEIDPAN